MSTNPHIPLIAALRSLFAGATEPTDDTVRYLCLQAANALEDAVALLRTQDDLARIAARKKTLVGDAPLAEKPAPCAHGTVWIMNGVVTCEGCNAIVTAREGQRVERWDGKMPPDPAPPSERGLSIYEDCPKLMRGPHSLLWSDDGALKCALCKAEDRRVPTLTAERDALKAEVERLTRERNAALNDIDRRIRSAAPQVLHVTDADAAAGSAADEILDEEWTRSHPMTAESVGAIIARRIRENTAEAGVDVVAEAIRSVMNSRCSWTPEDAARAAIGALGAAVATADEHPAGSGTVEHPPGFDRAPDAALRGPALASPAARPRLPSREEIEKAWVDAANDAAHAHRNGPWTPEKQRAANRKCADAVLALLTPLAVDADAIVRAVKAEDYGTDWMPRAAERVRRMLGQSAPAASHAEAVALLRKWIARVAVYHGTPMFLNIEDGTPVDWRAFEEETRDFLARNDETRTPDAT